MMVCFSVCISRELRYPNKLMTCKDCLPRSGRLHSNSFQSRKQQGTRHLNVCAVKKDSVEASEAKVRQRQEAERMAQEEVQRKQDEVKAAELGKPDADVAAPDEPAGDHITTTEPSNTSDACCMP